jgi:hypothetical protein
VEVEVEPHKVVEVVQEDIENLLEQLLDVIQDLH